MERLNGWWLAVFAALPLGCGSVSGASLSNHDSTPEEGGNSSGTSAPTVEAGTQGMGGGSNRAPATAFGGTPEKAPASSDPDGGSHPDSTPPAPEGGSPGSPATCGGELHLVGLYEGGEVSGSAVGVTRVHVERPGSHVLVLSAYEPVRWTVSVAPEAKLERVILNGGEPQEAVVPEGVPVEFYDHETRQNQLFSPSHKWSEAWGVGNLEAPVAIVESKAERPLTTFSGCYKAGNITLHADSSLTTDCPVTSVHVNPACRASSVEFLNTGTSNENVGFIPDSSAEAWCWMLAPIDEGTVGLQQINPKDGTFFQVAQFAGPKEEPLTSLDTAGLALLNGRLVFAGYMGNTDQWAQIDLGTRLLTIGGDSNHVNSVASNGHELMVPCGIYGEEVCVFESFLALGQGRPSRRIHTGLLEGTSFTTRGDLIYSARFSGDKVFVHDARTGTQLNTIPLEGFEGWNSGISLTSDRLYLAEGRHAGSPACILTFDRDTGAQLNRVCVEGDDVRYWSGLWCDGLAGN